MKIAFIIFDGMTALDFVGVYDPVTRLKTMGFIPDLEWDICGLNQDAIAGSGLQFKPTRTGEPLRGYDVVIVPGGFATSELVNDSQFISWLKTAEGCLNASVCTGSILLGAAGFLKGRKATTHPGSFDDLRPYCEEVVDQRVVDEGDVITARGVTSAIDLGLFLCEKLAGKDARERISKQMDYSCYSM